MRCVMLIESEVDMRTIVRRHMSASAMMLALMVASTASAADYPSMSGQELYKRFCASCHGSEGRGDGPVATSFKIEVPDLTLIARRQGGKFSPQLIERVVDGRHIIGAHGTREMPVWGAEFTRSESGNPQAERDSRIVISKIVEYLATLQRPSP